MPTLNTTHLEDVIGHFTDAMLVTMDPDVGMRARPMRIVSQEGADLVFSTTLDNDSVRELLNDSSAVCTMQSDYRYVSITGRAAFIDDAKGIESHWKPAMKAWYPGGPEQDNLVLIKINAVAAEYWDMSGATRVRHALQLVKALVTNQPVKEPKGPGVNEQVQL